MVVTPDYYRALVSKTGAVSSATLISRVLGYARDMLIAKFFGASMAADAFFVAYKIPNLLRRLLGEGSLSTSFIPVYTEYLTNKSRQDSENLIRSVFGAFGILFIILSGAGIIFAPQIVSVIAPGFAGDPDKLALTVILTRIMFPFLMAIGLGAITLGILNSKRMFFIPAVAPSMLSISEILFILFLTPFFDPPVKALAFGVVAGGFAQFLVQAVPIIKKQSIIPSFNLKHPGLRKIGTLMLPAVAGLAVFQVNSLVDTVCATLLREGSVSFLYYGNRLAQFPLALFGTALATVTLPMMSENAARKEMGPLKDTFSFSLRVISFLMLPATVGLAFFGKPIVELLFQRGEFTSAHTLLTARVLIYYASGLIFFAGVKVATSAFHSLQDTKTPVIIACAAMLLNAVLNVSVVLIPFLRELLGAGGLALATSVASALNFILLILVFRKRKGLIGGRRIASSLWRHLAASCGLAFFLLRASAYSREWNLFIRVPALIAGGTFLYLLISRLLKVPELERVRRTFFQK